MTNTNNYTPNTLNQYSAVPAVSSGLDYDDDGNATAYPMPQDANANAVLTWDAENRLVQVQMPNSGPTIAYDYDYLNRRISRSESSNITRWVYDGWNPIVEYAATTIEKSYLWGMDLSGSMQGAGGVGGLLAVTDEAESGEPVYYPTYDGNGNVSEYLSGTGVVVAHYEYDLFGKEITPVAQKGSKHDDFAHRFSSKPIDADTGLYYYGYRYYDPVTGRWPSRDPLGENFFSGELNLHAFVANDGINFVDLVGMRKTRNCEKNLVEVNFDQDGLPLRGGVGISVDGGIFGRISFEKETCEECCDDGSWKEVKTYKAGASSGGGNIRVVGGAAFGGTSSGVGIDAWAGIKAEAEFTVSILFLNAEFKKGGCENKEEFFSGLVNVDGTASIEGGVEASVYFGRFNFTLIKGVVGGEVTANLGFGVKCDEAGCTKGAINGSLSGDAYGEACFAGVCYRKSFFN